MFGFLGILEDTSAAFAAGANRGFMKYQLVLQFPGASLSDYDAAVRIEEALNDALNGSAEVDGHDVGADQVNLFIWTDDPSSTFAQAKEVLERLEQFEWVTAAYRADNGDSYTVLWPEDWRKEFKVG